jgi:hypothetical protein
LQITVYVPDKIFQCHYVRTQIEITPL